MNVYISYSAKDDAIFQMIRSRLEEKSLHVLVKGKSLELFPSLVAKNKHRIDLSNLCIVLFSPNGKGNYLVHCEEGYMNMSGKDYFILESNGGGFTLRECRFGRARPALENDCLHETWDDVRTTLEQAIPDLTHKSCRMIFHTDTIAD